MTSLRHFLLASLSAALALVVGITALVGYYGARHEAEELLDGQMTQYAHLLLASLKEMQRTRNLPADAVINFSPHLHGDPLRHNERYAEQFLFQYWHNDRLLARSENAPDDAFYRPESGFHTIRYRHIDWRVFVLADDDDHWLMMAESHFIRDEFSRKLIIPAVLPVLLGLPLLLAIIWWVVGFGTRRLQGIALQLQQRNADDLSPLDTRQAPQEVRGMLDALNGLFLRLKTVLELEKRFTADAAHELRTPITAIKLHVQNALADTAPDHPAHTSLEHAHTATQRMSHIVQQLLTLNRGLIQGPSTTLVPVALDRLATAITHEHQGVAHQHGQHLESHVELASVQGHAEMLQILLRNLIDNALRYTPAGGHIRVSVHHTATGTELSVSDSGPGIPPTERERVLERFYRLGGDAHSSGQDGCGLGLSIVQRIADYHGAILTLDEDPSLHGLRVTLAFPA